MIKNLRELAKEYAQNVIDQESYRRSRRELIQGICAGKIHVEKHEYLAPLDSYSEELDVTAKNAVTQIMYPANISQAASAQVESERPQAEPESRSRSRPIPPPETSSSGIFSQKNIIIATAIIIALSIIALTILLFPTTEDSPTSNTNHLVLQPSPGQSLIVDFIQEKNWSHESLESFSTSWSQLSDQEHSATSTSPEMKRLTNIIYQKLLDERALLSLGDVENAVANQQMLVNFAEQLGIDDKRLTVVKPEPAVGIDIETKIPQTEIVDTIDTKNNLIDSHLESTPETAHEIKNDLSADVPESLDAITEKPMEIAAATDISIDTVPTLVTENQDSVEDVADIEIPVQEEIPLQEIKTELPDTKTAVQKLSNTAACNTSLLKSRKPFCRDKIEGVGYGPTMVVIQSGKFTMGGKNKDEQPAHTVTIGSHFAMSAHEISYGEYEEFCQSTNLACPKQPWSGKDYPVVSITHNDAASYTEWLTQNTGRTYRLPSEAEWEYAARAGTTSEYPFGDEILITNAVFSDKKQLSAPLPKTDRSINRNKFRLYHMVGNVREWVADTWHEDYSGGSDDGRARTGTGKQFVVRGGSYADTANALRSAARKMLSSADNYTGFRVLQELSE